MIALLWSSALAGPPEPIECAARHEPAPSALVPGASLRCADLRGRDLRGQALAGADLAGAWLHDADLSGADLSGALLEQAHAEGARFVSADLSGARLARATVRFADFREANLTGADFCETDLTASRNLTWTRTDETRHCLTTALPPEVSTGDGSGWRYVPFQRARTSRPVTFRSLDNLGVTSFIDWGADKQGEIDIFNDGEVSISVSLVSVDVVPDALNWNHRHWLSGIGATGSLGFGAGAIDSGRTVPIYALSVGPFVEVFSFLTVEAGGTYSVTTASGLNWDTRDDSGFFAGARLQLDPATAFAGDLAHALAQRATQ